MAVFIILAIVLLLAFFMFIPVKIQFFIKKTEQDNKTEIRIKYLFFKFSKKEKLKKTDNIKSAPERNLSFVIVKDIYTSSKKDILSIVSYLKKKAVLLENIDFELDFGYQDAASTGMMTGIINGAAYNIVSILCNNLKVITWDIRITPDFENEKFDAKLCCIAKIKTAHIIVVGLMALKILFKICKVKKGRE